MFLNVSEILCAAFLARLLLALSAVNSDAFYWCSGVTLQPETIAPIALCYLEPSSCGKPTYSLSINHFLYRVESEEQ